MKSLPRYLFITIYAALGMLLLLVIADLLGFHTGPLTRLLLIAAWIGVCFSGHRWLTGFLLSTQKIRKTILEEEEWLHPLMHELNLRTEIDPAPELMILEEPRPVAYAIGRKTIVLSRGLLVNLSEPEIKAVLAHEYGHLKHGDTLAGSAFWLALLIPDSLYRLVHFSGKGGKSTAAKRLKLIVGLAVVVAMLLAGYPPADLFLILGFFFIFIKGFPAFQSLVMAIWCSFTRRDEFRQDRFAQSLGCGSHLKSALLKLDALGSDSLASGLMQLWASHPMLYARIRRLEWLEGRRPTP